MPCTEGRLARFLKWTIHRPSSVTAAVIASTDACLSLCLATSLKLAYPRLRYSSFTTFLLGRLVCFARYERLRVIKTILL